MALTYFLHVNLIRVAPIAVKIFIKRDKRYNFAKIHCNYHSFAIYT